MTSGKNQEPDYTKVPNWVIDRLMPLVGESELKVTLFIARKTIGWHKGKDKLSLSQIMKGTGMSRQGALNGISRGVERKTIIREKAGQGYVYSLVNEVDQSTILTSQRSRPVLVNEVDQLGPKTGLRSRHTKEKNIKKGKERGETCDPVSVDEGRVEKDIPPFKNSEKSKSRGENQSSQTKTIVAQVKACGVDPKQFVVLVDRILSKHGFLELVNNGHGDAHLSQAQSAVRDLVLMHPEQFRTVEGIESIYADWQQNDWRAKSQPLPKTNQLIEHAGTMISRGSSPQQPPATKSKPPAAPNPDDMWM